VAQNDMRQPLLEPYTLGDLPLRNRVVMAPLTRTRAENQGHVPTDLMRQYYEQRVSSSARAPGSAKTHKGGTEFRESTTRNSVPHGTLLPTPFTREVDEYSPSCGMRVLSPTLRCSLTAGSRPALRPSTRSNGFMFAAVEP
jgi:hypothetical protein